MFKDTYGDSRIVSIIPEIAVARLLRTIPDIVISAVATNNPVMRAVTRMPTDEASVL